MTGHERVRTPRSRVPENGQYLLEVNDLKTHFLLDQGIVRAVRRTASGGVPSLGAAPVHADTTPPHLAG